MGLMLLANPSSLHFNYHNSVDNQIREVSPMTSQNTRPRWLPCADRQSEVSSTREQPFDIHSFEKAVAEVLTQCDARMICSVTSACLYSTLESFPIICVHLRNLRPLLIRTEIPAG